MGDIPELLSENLATLIEKHPNSPKKWEDVEAYIQDLFKLKRSIVDFLGVMETVWPTGMVLTRVATWAIINFVEFEIEVAYRAVRNKMQGTCQTCNCNPVGGPDSMKLNFTILIHEVIEGFIQDKHKRFIVKKHVDR